MVLVSDVGPRGVLLEEQELGSSQVNQVGGVLTGEFKLNQVLHSIFKVRLLKVASISFSFIKQK